MTEQIFTRTGVTIKGMLLKLNLNQFILISKTVAFH